MVILLLLFGAFAPAAMAAWPRCNPTGCHAQDFTITDAWVVADPHCRPGHDTTAKLWVNFWSNRKASRYCIVSVVDVWAGTDKIYDDLTNDSVGTIEGKGNFPRMLSEITWTCGEELKLDNIYVQWMVHSSNPCPGECGNNYPTGQCWMGGPIYVRAPLIANFTFDNVCFGTDTTFTDKTTGGSGSYTIYDWDFGDGTPHSTDQNPTHPYAIAKEYTVTLTVTDSDGNIDSQSYDVEVYANPVADFTATPTSCCTPLTVTFTDLSTAGDNPITSWSWDFDNDGTPDSTVQNPSYQYSTSGTYTVNLTVTDSHGCTDYEVKIDYITANEGPTADFSATPLSCCTPLTVTFTDLSTAGDNPITSWSWDFDNDGTPDSTVQNPSYQYSTSGTYTVNLTVTDSHGCTDYEVKIDYITANENPTATASSNSPVCEGNLLTLTGGPDGMATYSWTGADNFSSSVQSPTVSTSATLAMAGDYILTVTDANGCTDYASTTVVVNTKPTADAGPDKSISTGGSVEIGGSPTASGGTSPYTYSWTPITGLNATTIANPNASPTSTTTYTVTVTDANGCVDSDDVVVTVTYSISGMKFNDLNGNGIKDAGKPGLSGWTINLEQPAGTVIDSTTTAADGSYIFTYLDPGDYTVREVLKPGWVQTCPAAPGTYSVTLIDTSSTGNDFGNRGDLSISGMKFKDLNGNGIKDADEPGLPGWTIYNDSNNNGVFDPGELNVTTGAGGAYSFDNLEPETYKICEVVKDGWAQTSSPICYDIMLTDTSSTGNDFGNRGALSISLEKTGSPTTVAPGGNVTYTINYTNTGTVPLHNVVITEYYPKGVTFISADPAPDAGTNNVWTIGTLLPGESGTIVIEVKVPEQVDLSFTETGSVIGEGLVMVTKDLSTEQKPYSLRNRVTLSCDELAPRNAYATTKVSGVPGTSLGITESGSGVYSSDEILDLETKNKTIILEKSTHAEYKPTSFNFSDSFSITFTNKWKQDICSRNMEIDAAIHKKISDATYIDDETISRVDKDKSTMNFDSSFNGSMYIGARTKNTEISETYIGEFDVLQTIQIAKGPIPTPAPTPTPTPIWLPCPYNDSPEMNMTEEPTP